MQLLLLLHRSHQHVALALLEEVLELPPQLVLLLGHVAQPLGLLQRLLQVLLRVDLLVELVLQLPGIIIIINMYRAKSRTSQMNCGNWFCVGFLLSMSFARLSIT